MDKEEQDREQEENKKHKKFNGDGSPIMVGGGGGLGGEDDDDRKRREGKITCDFYEVHYPDPDPQNEGKKLFENSQGWQIETFKIYTASTGWVDYTADLPADRECTIEVHCRGNRDDVTIHGENFGIDMDTRTYQRGANTAHTNPNASSFIFRVDLRVGLETTHTWPDPRRDFTKADDCRVCTDHVPNSTFCS